MTIRRKAIKAKVESLLSECDVTKPAIPVRRIAKHLGLQIVEAPDDDHLSGFLVSDAANNRYVIGVNKGHPLNRKRFTIAHEIGHYALKHRGGAIHVDENTTVRFVARSPRSSEGEDLHEIEANAFAAELLMPAAFLEDDVTQMKVRSDLDDEALAKELASKYKVSLAAMSFRLVNLGLV